MSKKRKPPTAVPVLPDPEDFPARWALACRNYMAETKDQCDECLEEFRTADVLYVFEAPAAVATGKFFLCSRCGYMAFHSGSFPIATVIYIAEEHRAKRAFDLGELTRIRLVEAFAQVDSIHEHVAKLAAHYGGLAGVKGGEEPS